MTHAYIKHKATKTVGLILLFFSGPLFLILTDPSKLPLPLLIFPFVWLFACLFISTWLLLRNKRNVSQRQVVMVAGVVATLPVILAVFQSIHQLSIRDVLLSVALVFLAALYMLRADFIR